MGGNSDQFLYLINLNFILALVLSQQYYNHMIYVET